MLLTLIIIDDVIEEIIQEYECKHFEQKILSLCKEGN